MGIRGEEGENLEKGEGGRNVEEKVKSPSRLRKKAPGSVIPSEARNLSLKKASKKRDSSSLRSSQ
jgi:hypothetical protein